MRYLFHYCDRKNCVLFSLKCTKNRLAAGLCPDPLGELECSRDPLVVLGWGVGWDPTGGVGKGEG